MSEIFWNLFIDEYFEIFVSTAYLTGGIHLAFLFKFLPLILFYNGVFLRFLLLETRCNNFCYSSTLEL
jgi:hypothetical protein